MKCENVMEIIERLESAKDELIQTARVMEGNLPASYWKKLDTIISKVEILESQIHSKFKD